MTGSHVFPSMIIELPANSQRRGSATAGKLWVLKPKAAGKYLPRGSDLLMLTE